MHDSTKDLEISNAALRAEVSGLKKAEENLRMLNAALEQSVAELNREVESFSYSVSHDLRAPLRHVNGFTRILLDDYGEAIPPEARQVVEKIAAAGRHMTALVDGLLGFSRLGRQRLARRPTDLNVILANTREELAAETAGREIEWRIAPLPVAWGDPPLLKIVFGHLLSNAVKFTRPRGTAMIEVGVSVEDGSQTFCVRDNGVGFDPRYADKLFGVFQRLHRQEEFEGTGIGLASVQRIVHRHGGRIWAESELDRGAAFFFTLSGRAAETDLEEPKVQREPNAAR